MVGERPIVEVATKGGDDSHARLGMRHRQPDALEHVSAECLVVDHGEELFELADDEQKLGAVIWQYARYGTPKPVRVTLELLDQAPERMRREIL